MQCNQCGRELDYGSIQASNLYFCTPTCMGNWVNEKEHQLKEIYRFYWRDLLVGNANKSSTGITFSPAVAMARQQYQSGRYRIDGTERLIQNTYRFQPRQRDAKLAQYRQRKFQNQVAVNKQFLEQKRKEAIAQRTKEEFAKKYGRQEAKTALKAITSLSS